MNKMVQEHYDDLPNEYTEQYSRERFTKREGYIANYVRLQHILGLLSAHDAKAVLDAGCGEGSPLIKLIEAGYDVYGFDFSSAMVRKARENLRVKGHDESRVIEADVSDVLTFSHLGNGKKADAVMALGVFPHVENETVALANLKIMTKKGGLVIVEFRNALFNMFALNALSRDFYMKELFFSVNSLSDDVRRKIERDIDRRFEMNYPEKRIKNPGSDAPGYDAILSKFHNPLEISKLFDGAGMDFVKNIFYHYHPYPPYYEQYDQKSFCDLSANLEHEESDWRGHFMASAFLAVGIVR